MNEQPLTIRETSDGCTFQVRVHPGAKRNEINGIHDGAVKLSLTTAPTDGKANAALLAYLSELLNVPRTKLAIASGATSRSKILRIRGLKADALELKLRASLPTR